MMEIYKIDSQRNHETSLSVSLVALLVCRHSRQLIKVDPGDEA